MNKKERIVAAIENGTVIDHIPADKTFQVATMLGLQEMKTIVTIGNNYPSILVGKKGIIKIHPEDSAREGSVALLPRLMQRLDYINAAFCQEY